MAGDAAIRDGTAAIIDEVRRGGDAALRQFNQRFDGADFTELKVGEDEIDRAQEAMSPPQLAAIDLAIRNVRSFHRAQLPESIRVETMAGVVCERHSHAIDAVGLYVPAGTAPLPSAAIMLAVPADIAGCPIRILCTPPRPDGTADPAVIVAATRSG